MYLTFRQGIARYQTDVNGMPAFLKKSNQTGQFVDLIVSPDPTIIVFAHKDATYIVEETKTISKAWGPFPNTPNSTEYLFWDISLLDGQISRGFTYLEPIYSSVAPHNPANEQHWFDNQTTTMKVWNGSKWLEKVRVFAGKYSSTAVLISYPVGTQAGLTGQFEGGNLILDSFNKPLRQTDGAFVTSATKLAIVGMGTNSVQFEAQMLSGMANEYIAKFSLVQLAGQRKILLGRTADPMSRIAGIVTEDLYESESGRLITTGLVRNEQWNFPLSSINRPVFCGPTGQVTLNPPQAGVCQIAGFVFDKDSIFMQIQQPIILDDIETEVDPVEPVPVMSAPIANFSATPRVGTSPLTVQFTSTTSSNPTRLEWDFQNNGTVDAVGQTVTHTYLEPGNYSVRLHAVNEYGQDDNVKTDHIVVSAPGATGTKTNLESRIGAPMQVKFNQVFSISITTNNDGLKEAKNVLRVVTFSNYANANLQFSNLPQGSLMVTDKGKTIITLPPLASLVANSPVNVIFNVVAPASSTKIDVVSTAFSAQQDSNLADNTAKISIAVKP